ncbi:Clp protease ClpP (plasmid) [Azospirillum brasilense]|uniref:ATP-dependent Clp protease proteolytic subunit n=1 Tax=Azospirillum brasilense TaxID=192 RepID=A0A4D8R6Z4_AZOBR|nr:Clp protease ClpP [Azospirillum brasilense]
MVSTIVRGNEIVLTGTVGGDPWWDDDVFSQADVINALAQVGRNTDVTVRVNSGGGVATEGAAIHAVFAAHKGKVNMVVEGWAASAASLFVMSGDTVTMRPGALLMIHDPSAGSWGTCDDHRRVASALDTMGGTYAQVYADRCGKSPEEVREMMRAETWLGPAEAVAQGFADAAEADGVDTPEPVAFAHVRAYARAPEHIVALAKSRGWGARASLAATAAAPTRPTMEAPLPEENTPTDDKTVVTPPAEADAPADPVAIAEACATAGFATLTAGFLKSKATMKAVNAALSHAKDIAAACDTLRVPNMKNSLVQFVATGGDMQVARNMATDAAAARDEAIVTDTTRQPLAPVSSGWSAAVAKLKK